MSREHDELDALRRHMERCTAASRSLVLACEELGRENKLIRAENERLRSQLAGSSRTTGLVGDDGMHGATTRGHDGE
jgi:regulator of replication initiation timing